MNLNSTAIFNSDDMTTIMTDLFNDQSSINVDSSGSTSTTEPLPNESSLNETITASNAADRRYLLVIFNDPNWSKKIGKKPQQAEQRQTRSMTNRSVAPVVKSEKQDLSVDDLFTAQLRQLIGDYMQRTTRPFPVRYFIDFTDN